MLLRLFNDESELVDHSQVVRAPRPPKEEKEKVWIRNSSSPEPSDAVTADGAEGLKMASAVDDGEEGGVSLNGYLEAEATAQKIPTEENYLQTEDMVLGEKQNQKDQLEQTAPFVTDEPLDSNSSLRGST